MGLKQTKSMRCEGEPNEDADEKAAKDDSDDDNMEDMVEDRIVELATEKLKCDDLICKMLPRSIAEQLKEGKHVEAEMYECVTICHSNIEEFTSLVQKSTPLQVIALLNDLYYCFDCCCDNYDVYKFEAIGDSYMVASGVPIRNGNLHAGEIATLSLDFLHNIQTFRIRHLPEDTLQVRIGIHSGPIVAGVVGLKMPRYSLFGDSVIYASQIGSSGLALRVHVSPECKSMLDILGKYNFTERGPVEMKGIGTINTYFLTMKETYDKSLPDLS